MLIVREFWALIILFTFAISPGARNAAGLVTTRLWQMARHVSKHSWKHGGRPLLVITFIVMILAITASVIGYFWRPALIAAPIILIAWFLLLRGGLSWMTGIIKGAETDILEPLIRELTGAEESESIDAKDVEKTQKNMVEALGAGVKPLTWVGLCAAVWGIQIIVFPTVTGTIGIFVVLVIVALNLAGALLERATKVAEWTAWLFTMIAIPVFAAEILSFTAPGAAAVEWLSNRDRQLAAMIGVGSGKTWKDAITEEHKSGMEREFNRVFDSSRYINFWNKKDTPAEQLEMPQIFHADGTEIKTDTTEYKKTLAELDTRPFVVIKDTTAKEVPEKVKNATNRSIAFVHIQQGPSQAKKLYWVPSRCIDWGSETREAAAQEGYRHAVATKRTEILEGKLADFKDETATPQWWRVEPLEDVKPLKDGEWAFVWTPEGKKHILKKGTLAYIIEEGVDSVPGMPKVPEKLIKIQLHKHPSKLCIIRASDGEKIADPFAK